MSCGRQGESAHGDWNVLYRFLKIEIFVSIRAVNENVNGKTSIHTAEYEQISVYLKYIYCIAFTHSGELRFKPSVVKSIPGAKATRLGSISAVRINVNRPTMPN